ncbi:MAG: hypothetical protein GF311_22850 [Candidatus Lokiarchaeota archaeon]|nr:hypothetical protein [Candidatus Lokiarchaeota archaeon]
MFLKYIEEEKLKFGKDIEAFDPRIGLLRGGPYSSSISDGEREFKIINCGIIGTKVSKTNIISLIDRISHGLKANDKTYGNLGFPGLGIQSPLQFSIRFSDEWYSSFNDNEIDQILEASDNNLKKNILFQLIEEKIINLKYTDPPPDIIFIPVERDIIKAFQHDNIESNNIVFANRNKPRTVSASEGDINFHSILKIIGMKHNIVTQLIKSKTLKLKMNEDVVTTAWNLIVGLYYKAKRIPWKFTEFEDQVCYVGISFYRDFSEKEVKMGTSMAQVFLSSGDSYILKGDSFKIDKQEDNRSPNLDRRNAKNIIDKVLKFYKKLKKIYPLRLVIYKTSNFTDSEIEGIYDNIADIKNIDMISINENPKIRLYRQDQYPVMRGTTLITEDHKEAILYTIGFIPSLNTYPGHQIPKPIKIRQFTSNTDMITICREILKLTRLDWNDIKFCHKMPVTLSFPKKVSKVLVEKRAADINIQPHYRFYM